MKVHLEDSWTLTDEHPKARKGKPILLDLGTWKVYQPGDRIGEISALKFVSLAVEWRGKEDFLPEEIQFISRFKDGNHQIQSNHETQPGRARKHEKGVTTLGGFHPTGRA